MCNIYNDNTVDDIWYAKYLGLVFYSLNCAFVYGIQKKEKKGLRDI